jgi:hypothetical protein
MCAVVLDEFERRPEKRVVSSIEVTSEGGEFQTGEMSQPITLAEDWDGVLRGFGLDPEVFYVVDDTVRMSKWQQSKRTENGDRDVVWLYAYKARFARRSRTDDVDFLELCKMVEKRKPGKIATSTSDNAFVVLLSDWQLGKGEGGGTPATIERIVVALDKAVAHYKALKKAGRVGVQVYLVGLGDLVEACNGWYPMQTFQADLSDREQDKLARRLILMCIEAFVELGCEVVAAGVPGNHGENRVGGKAYTNFLDNRDYAAFETVSEICAASPRYDHVTFVHEAINDDDLTLTLDIAGVPVAFAHGHQFRSGANAQAKMENWWKSQVMGNTGVARAAILFAGHLHHFVASEAVGRQVFQVPAMDGGSQWFQATAGANAQAGMLTVVIGSDLSRGWDDLKIL